LRGSDALDISGSRELLQHFRHVVARHVEMIGNRGRASPPRRLARRISARNPKSVKAVSS
jgi:hypothetical protein